jgi:ferrochelatase
MRVNPATIRTTSPQHTRDVPSSPNPAYLGTDAASFSHAQASRAGVLLCNLGTPEAPTPKALRKYLAEFLSDPRLIELPRWLWLPILHGIILNVRPRRSAHAYAKIWTDEGSPLLAWSKAQAAAVSTQLASVYGEGVQVALAMRYGSPSIADGLETLRVAGVRRLVVLPLYPQYSGPATGSVFDAVASVLQGWRWVPDVRFVSSYHDDPAYIAALASSVQRHWAEFGRGDRLFFSFHGLPHRYFTQGDPYFCQCQATARAVAEHLDLAPDAWQVVFQSRFGRERWLEPYADITLQAAARAGVRVADVVCPGFAADCLETLEEIAIQNREAFIAAGGEDLRYIPALNANAAHISALCGLLTRQMQGWPELSGAEPEHTAQLRCARAQALGARA